MLEKPLSGLSLDVHATLAGLGALARLRLGLLLLTAGTVLQAAHGLVRAELAVEVDLFLLQGIQGNCRRVTYFDYRDRLASDRLPVVYKVVDGYDT